MEKNTTAAVTPSRSGPNKARHSDATDAGGAGAGDEDGSGSGTGTGVLSTSMGRKTRCERLKQKSRGVANTRESGTTVSGSFTLTIPTVFHD
jgi:hypothetical protein